MHELVTQGDFVIGRVTVGHQRRTFADACKQHVRRFEPATSGIGEAADRRTRTAHLRPQVALRLRPAAFFLQDLIRRFVDVLQPGVEQRVAHQVDDRLCGQADANHACRDRVRRNVAAEATQQTGLPIQRHAELIFAGRDPRERRFGQQSTRDDARRHRCNLDAEIAARARILDALMLDDANLLRDHVELLADLDAEFDERMAVVRAEALGFGQLVPHELARQIGIERFAVTALLARMFGDGRARGIFLCGCRVRAERFGFIEQTELL
ncbi:MAG: hypothetical protein GAK39_00607 [Variovorax sp.]|nr:MAG: hypothetical protein GAK39_00607 [Variovorax sp.]